MPNCHTIRTILNLLSCYKIVNWFRKHLHAPFLLGITQIDFNTFSKVWKLFKLRAAAGGWGGGNLGNVQKKGCLQTWNWSNLLRQLFEWLCMSLYHFYQMWIIAISLGLFAITFPKRWLFTLNLCNWESSQFFSMPGLLKRLVSRHTAIPLVSRFLYFNQKWWTGNSSHSPLCQWTASDVTLHLIENGEQGYTHQVARDQSPVC